MALLEVDNVSLSFGGIRALQQVSLHIEEGEIMAIIGPNGAGKTTLFNCISGLHHADSGSIRLAGTDIAGYPPHLIARLGVARTFQNLRLFRNLTVLENVLIGGYVSGGSRHRADRAMELLEFVGISDQAFSLAGSLPYGAQRRLELARALAMSPRLILLDEPAAGMSFAEIQDLLGLFRTMRDRGLTIALVEHDMRLVMNVSDRVAVLDYGKKIAEGIPAEVRANQAVLDAYLGEESG